MEPNHQLQLARTSLKRSLPNEDSDKAKIIGDAAVNKTGTIFIREHVLLGYADYVDIMVSRQLIK